MPILYEVHTLKGGNWMIDSTYSDRDKAVDTAKQLYAEKRFEGVKVIKDDYDSDANQGREIVIYDTSKPTTERRTLVKEAPKAAPPTDGKAEVDFKHRKHKTGAKAEVSVFLRSVIWLLVILGAGITIIWLLFAFTDFLAGAGIMR
jgi:hypothetical protein